MAESIKKRNWTFVLYPESAPKDWMEQIKLSGLLSAVSPLHDKDVNPTGEAKKAHHHILLVYSGPTTYNAVAKFTASLNATIPQALESVRGMYRYFSHKDNPEKYQYPEEEIVTLNGFNIADLVELTKSEVNELKMKILKLIRDVDIYEYSGLVDFLIDNEMTSEYDVAINNTFFFHTYITSRRNAVRQEAEDLAKIEVAKIKAQRIASREAEKQEAVSEGERCTEYRTPFD
jgi:hypothetical protein